MTRTVTFLVTFLFVGLMASPSVQPAEANWHSSYDGPNSGYCASARTGRPISHYLAKDPRSCPENRSGTVRQKTQQGTPVKKPNLAARPGAQQLPSANISPVVLSEQRTQVWRTFNLNPDCPAADVIVAKVTKEGKGQVEFEENMGFSTYPKNSQKYECNIQQTAGLSIFYTSPTGFKGTDSFEIELVNGRGQSRKASFRVTVK